MNLKFLPYLFGVFALWLLSYFVIRSFFPIPAEGGQIGDTFGAINALFSGLAFAAVVYTIRQQQREIKDQEAQHYRQQFDSRFFKLLENRENLKNYIKNENEWIFQQILSDIRAKGSFMEKDRPEFVKIFDERFYNASKSLLLYVKTFKLLIRYLGASNLSLDDKNFYFDIIDTKIEIDERVFWFYYAGLSSEAEEITKQSLYKLFDSIRPDDIQITHIKIIPEMLNKYPHIKETTLP